MESEYNIYKIYGLYDFRNGSLRYIGSTSGPLMLRYQSHIGNAKRGYNKPNATKLNKWIHSVNYQPLIEILTIMESRQLMLHLERYLIMTRPNLLNRRFNDGY